MLTILTGISKFSKGTYKQPLEVLLFETKLYPTHKGTSQYTEESAAQTNEWCLSGIESALKAGFDVCIANSKSEDWNITPYLYLAEKYTPLLIE